MCRRAAVLPTDDLLLSCGRPPVPAGGGVAERPARLATGSVPSSHVGPSSRRHAERRWGGSVVAKPGRSGNCTRRNHGGRAQGGRWRWQRWWVVQCLRSLDLGGPGQDRPHQRAARRRTAVASRSALIRPIVSGGLVSALTSLPMPLLSSHVLASLRRRLPRALIGSALPGAGFSPCLGSTPAPTWGQSPATAWAPCRPVERPPYWVLARPIREHLPPPGSPATGHHRSRKLVPTGTTAPSNRPGDRDLRAAAGVSIGGPRRIGGLPITCGLTTLPHVSASLEDSLELTGVPVSSACRARGNVVNRWAFCETPYGAVFL